jgi:Icc-related predicted phosphoesterase
MQILSLSDIPVQLIYSPQIRRRFAGISMAVGCGDLPYAYQEYVISMLDVPFFYVRGNHDQPVEFTVHGEMAGPRGGISLHRKVMSYQGLILGGVDGSLRYRPGPFQYSQRQMWLHVFSLVPAMLLNRLRHGRYLDIFVTHAPPRGVHDMVDLPHQGINAFRWLIDVFQPAYYFHGHIHVYRPDTIRQTRVGKTVVINAYGYSVTEIKVGDQGSGIRD